MERPCANVRVLRMYVGQQSPYGYDVLYDIDVLFRLMRASASPSFRFDQVQSA
eukprot:CAMPEP_0117529924 /NCGR_PEP_ID=MMETSP0784-20121206/38079_1 /TAXON_ID=39447 /ORGANISM="" /LENGTH=52 /DNA_ID=CAMNT_0005326253 /DNA_START=703 /DNA_END=861 /DNA_ORIENTATION=+